MKNLINIYILLLLVVCSTLSSCSDWLDVNNNPNTAEKVEAGYLFNYAAVNWSGNRIGGDSYIPFSQSMFLIRESGAGSAARCPEIIRLR